MKLVLTPEPLLECVPATAELGRNVAVPPNETVGKAEGCQGLCLFTSWTHAA